MLVAVTVTVPAELGAVKSPLALIVPALADQFTAELKAPDPWTVALHCEVAFSASDDGVQVTVTDEMEDDGEEIWLLLEPPPQAAPRNRIPHIIKATKNRAGAALSCTLWSGMPINLVYPAINRQE